MNKTFVKYAQHDIDGGKRGDDQQEFIRQGLLEKPGGPLQTAADRGRRMERLHRRLDLWDRIAQRRTRRKLNEIVLATNRP